MELISGIFLTAYCLYVGVIAEHGLKISRNVRQSFRKDGSLTGMRYNVQQSLTKRSAYNGSGDGEARYTGPPDDELTDDQKAIKQEILETRPRTGLSGPFGPWLAVPEIAQPSQQLGRACRYGTSLSFAESELVILLTGARHRSKAEFEIHVPEALKAGLSSELIQSIPRDDDFTAASVQSQVIAQLTSERDIAIASFATELLIESTVSDEIYRNTMAILGQDSVLVEITSIVGYYTYVAYTLNVFNIPSTPTPPTGTQE